MSNFKYSTNFFTIVGSLRAQVKFSKPLPIDLTLLCIGEFSAFLSIDKNGVIQTSFTTTWVSCYDHQQFNWMRPLPNYDYLKFQNLKRRLVFLENSFKEDKMFSTVIVFAILATICKCSIPTYLASCHGEIVFQELCFNFPFDGESCFPWDTQRCTGIEISSGSSGCFLFDCSVSLSVLYWTSYLDFVYRKLL